MSTFDEQRYDDPSTLAARGIEHLDLRGDGFGFLIETTDGHDSAIHPDHVPIDAVTCNLSVRAICSRGGRLPTDDIGSEPYLTAYMKWDSCMHIWFKEVGEEGYLHMCGIEAWTNHVALMERLYNKAFEVMRRVPQSGEEWPA